MDLRSEPYPSFLNLQGTLWDTKVSKLKRKKKKSLLGESETEREDLDQDSGVRYLRMVTYGEKVG